MRRTRGLALVVEHPDAPDPAAPQRVRAIGSYTGCRRKPSGCRRACAATTCPPAPAKAFNDWTQPGYRGPCPPAGRHRHFFRLYALDTEPPGLGQPDKARRAEAIKGHVIGQAERAGTCERGQASGPAAHGRLRVPAASRGVLRR